MNFTRYAEYLLVFVCLSNGSQREYKCRWADSSNVLLAPAGTDVLFFCEYVLLSLSCVCFPFGKQKRENTGKTRDKATRGGAKRAYPTWADVEVTLTSHSKISSFLVLC